jgi:general secretion pathway protein D
MRRVYAGAIGALALALFLGMITAPLSAAEGPPQNMITMNFQNVDIPVLAKFISEITGKNFIVDESVRGKVSIISPTKVTPDQAYQIFQSVLQLKGFTTVQAGKVIKIIPSRNVRQSAPLTQSQQPFEVKGDEYVTRMVKLRNVEVNSIISVVQPMVSHDGLVAAFPEDNTLIITDDTSNVERLLAIVGSLDVEGTHQNVEVIPLRFAFADDIAPEVEEILGGGSGQHPGGRPGQGVVAPAAQAPTALFKVIPDERTNSIVAVAGPIQMKQIREVVTKLDISPPNATSRIHVYRLKNASAPEMIDVLNGLLGGGGGPSSLSPQTGRGSLGRGSSLGVYGGTSGFGGMGGYGGGYGGGGISSFGGMSGYGGMGGGYGGMGGMMSGMGGGLGRRSSSGTGTAGTGPASASSSGKSAEFSNPVNVTADPATNSLVISAAPQDYQTIRTIVSELDVPRVQVFVQAIIVEVSAERQRNLGVNFQSSTGISNSTLGIGQLNFGQLQTALGNPLGLTGLGLGLASGSICSIPVALAQTATGGTTGTSGTSGTMNVPCDVALMTALESDTHSNVLSAPTLLTADNEEAMIVVGQNLPFVGSAAANAGLPGQIFNSVDRQNVGITLDIVPQVSEGDYVRLDLYEEVSNVLASTVNNPLGPTTTIRSASTTVLVQNHRTAVIGGLLSNNDNYQRQGVPWVSDIPVLGNLFSSTSSDKQKDNLLVFLTPHVVRNKGELRSLALDERQKFVNSLGAREMHNMPTSSVRELYAPTFSVAVPPSADLNQQYNTGASAPAAPAPPSTGGEKATPFNTEEIPPSPSSSARPPLKSPPVVGLGPAVAGPPPEVPADSGTAAAMSGAAASSSPAATASDPAAPAAAEPAGSAPSD